MNDMDKNYQSKVTIIIPSLNPDDKLVELVENLTNSGYKDIIVVNDGSSNEYDKYFESIKEKVVLLTHSINLGKGRALKTAFNEYLNCHKSKTGGVITVDSDGQHKIEDIKKVNKKLLKSKNSLILGARNFNNENVPFRSKFGNKLTRIIFSFLTGIKVTDTQTGLRGIPPKYIETLMNVQGERFEYEMNMIMFAKNNDINIEEETIETVYIQENKSSHFNPLTDSFKIYLIFFKYILSSLISFIVDIGLYKIFFNLLIKSLTNYVIIIATIGARIISSFVNYKINKNTVFKSSSKNSIIKYYALCIIQMIISAILVSYVYNLIGKQGEVLIKIIVDIILFFMNFKIQKEWVFKKGDVKTK